MKTIGMDKKKKILLASAAFLVFAIPATVSLSAPQEPAPITSVIVESKQCDFVDLTLDGEPNAIICEGGVYSADPFALR